jgi:translin
MEEKFDIKKPLSEIFNIITKELDSMDEIREKLFSIQRLVVRKSSEIIKQVHRKETQNIDSQLGEIQKLLIDFDKTVAELPVELPKDYELIVKQEYGEAILFYNLITNQTLLDPKAIGLNSFQYCYAIADVVGELRRYCLSCLIDDQIDQAVVLFRWMEEIYNILFSLDYPSGLLPGLRKKIDVARNLLNSTQSEVSMVLNLKRYGISDKKI